MTKVRDPATIQDAVMRIVGRITLGRAAELVGKVDKVVRNWTDADTGRCPTLEEAVILDAAYLASGGGKPPLLEAYRLMLDQARTPSGDEAALSSAVITLVRESGEANAAAVAALAPDSTPVDRANALRELTESMDAGARLVRLLKTPELSAIDGGRS